MIDNETSFGLVLLAGIIVVLTLGTAGVAKDRESVRFSFLLSGFVIILSVVLGLVGLASPVDVFLFREKSGAFPSIVLGVGIAYLLRGLFGAVRMAAGKSARN